MSNAGLIIPQRSRDIGDFLVGRFIPFSQKRMVGPFSFIDHMGPSRITSEKPFDVDQHPHIGLSTLTYLLEGEIEHRDSIGTIQRITPGSVNWMNAGKGVSHTERQPKELRGKDYVMNGYQIWVALPKDKEEMAPSFTHIPEADLPKWSNDGASFTLIAGEAFGRKSPVPVFSSLFMVEIQTTNAVDIILNGEIQGEIGILVDTGKIKACSYEIGSGKMLVSKQENACAFFMQENSRVFLFGGKAFEEERFIDWNFVASDKEKIQKAIEAWENRSFPMMPDDNTYVPYPKLKLKKK